MNGICAAGSWGGELGGGRTRLPAEQIGSIKKVGLLASFLRSNCTGSLLAILFQWGLKTCEDWETAI